jgi:nicotinate-nucleotide adenylyltransferase
MPTRIGVMGGTFDPIHIGHLVAAGEVAARFDLEEVVFVPTGQSWHKESGDISATTDRLQMTVIATATDERFSVSRVDIDRSGPTYTVDTLRDLAAGRGEGTEFFFITGADALAAIMGWRDHEEVLRRAHLVGVTRPGHVLGNPGLPAESVTFMEVPALAISSTQCRERVRHGLSLRYLVPDRVVEYIEVRHLYRHPAAGDVRA